MQYLDIRDELSELSTLSERAGLLIQEITEEFLEKYNPKTERGEFAILWEFDRYGIFAQMLRDYLSDMNGKINELSEAMNAFVKKVRNEKELEEVC